MKKIVLFLSLLSTVVVGQNRVVAHRGAWKTDKLPQNSLAALKRSFELGCVGTEFDLHRTKDGHIVVHHDADYFGHKIEEYSYAELNRKKLANGEDLPKLEAFLKMAKGFPGTLLFAEIKPSPSGAAASVELAEAVYQKIKKEKLLKRTVFISFSKDAVLHLSKKKVQVQYLNGELSPSALKEAGIAGADYHYSVFEREEKWIRDARSAGIKTNVWTVNSPAQLRYFLAIGVDYITTDEPELALGTAIRSLKWQEEFQESGLPNSQRWAYDVGGHGWGNNELQTYTEKDSSTAVVKDGKLVITAYKEGESLKSARLVTRGKQEFLYGRMEIRAKLPQGRGTWPAIWMLGTNIELVGWPRCGEIDIMEHVGYDPGVIVGTVHSEQYNHMIGTQITGQMEVQDFSTNFHTYAVEWSAEKIDFYVDEKCYVSIPKKGLKEWPFDAPHYLLLNLAIGGNWGGKMGVAEDIFPARFEIDYVRWYE
jgi:glycerophosphoryl diester phosphodiesterase